MKIVRMQQTNKNVYDRAVNRLKHGFLDKRTWKFSLNFINAQSREFFTCKQGA